MPTVDLFPIELRKTLPPLNAQEGDPRSNRLHQVLYS